MASVTFVSEQISFECEQQELLTDWLVTVCANENKELTELTYIFCSDEYLLGVNRKFLQHDYYTDVITFDYSENNIISGDVFISVDRVKENAQTADNQFIDELHRVMVHGLLHLIGYQDKEHKEKTRMTSLEDIYLSLRAFE